MLFNDPFQTANIANPYAMSTVTQLQNTIALKDLEISLEKSKKIQYEQTIRKSDTIFSTMVCPQCGNRLIFKRYQNDIKVHCPKEDYFKMLTIKVNLTNRVWCIQCRLSGGIWVSIPLKCRR